MAHIKHINKYQRKVMSAKSNNFAELCMRNVFRILGLITTGQYTCMSLQTFTIMFFIYHRNTYTDTDLMNDSTLDLNQE